MCGWSGPLLFWLAAAGLTAGVGAGIRPATAGGAFAHLWAGPVPATAVVGPVDRQADGGWRHIERGGRELAAGRHRVARKQWLKALAAGAEVARAAQERLRALSDAREFPRWRRAESEHFVLYAPRHTPPGRAPGRFLARREIVYRQIVDQLGIETGGPITIYAYHSDHQARRLIGRTLGFAEPARREIHIRHDQEAGHEEAHVIAWSWNGAGSGVPFLEEGLAVAMSSHPGSPHASAAETLAQDRLPSLADLIARFRVYRNGYVLAGSFVSDILERHGIDVIRELYLGGEEGDFLERLEAATGEPAATLQSRWETVLAAQGSANREDLLQAISLLRMGRLDAAIELLEAQRREQPDSAVVDFALAQAHRDQGDLQASAAAFRRVLRKPLPHRLAWIQQRAREALAELDGVPLKGTGTGE